MTDTAMVPAERKTLHPVQIVRNDIQRMESEFAAALPAHITPAKFVRTTLTAIQSNPEIVKVCGAEEGRRSVYQSAMKAAQDGLLPDGRESAFVIFGNKVQYMPMAQGLMKAMRNTGDIESIASRVVYANDKFEFVMGDEERIVHEPAPLDKDPGQPVGAYCVIRLKGGDCIREVMRKSEIEKVRAVSKAKNAGTWTGWWEEMARKTVLRRAYKYAPKSSDIDQMLQHDNETYDLDQHNRHSAGAVVDSIDNVVDITPTVTAADISAQAEDGVIEAETIREQVAADDYPTRLAGIADQLDACETEEAFHEAFAPHSKFVAAAAKEDKGAYQGFIKRYEAKLAALREGV